MDKNVISSGQQTELQLDWVAQLRPSLIHLTPEQFASPLEIGTTTAGKKCELVERFIPRFNSTKEAK